MLANSVLPQRGLGPCSEYSGAVFYERRALVRWRLEVEQQRHLMREELFRQAAEAEMAVGEDEHQWQHQKQRELGRPYCTQDLRFRLLYDDDRCWLPWKPHGVVIVLPSPVRSKFV